MAAKKASAPAVEAPAYAPPAWFAKSKDPWGAQFVRAGFSHSAEMDRAFALGWPHAVELVSGHPDDADPVVNASKGNSHVATWPAEVAARWARLRATKGFRRTPDGKLVLEPKGKKALETAGPITAKECGAFLKKILGSTDYAEDLRDMAMIFEACVGPDAFCTLATEAIEAAGRDALEEDDVERGFVVDHLGHALLRADRKLVVDLRARLEKVARTLEADASSSAQIRKLHLVLGGKAAAERCAQREGGDYKGGRYVPGTRLSVHDLRHVHDDPAFVAAAVRRQAEDPKFILPDPRLIFLAGADVSDFYAQHAKHLKSDGPRLVRELGAVRHPAIVQLMGEVARWKDSKAIATAWLAKFGG